MTTTPPIQVGSLVIAKRASGVCDPAERGVCCEVYELAGRPGWSFIFKSGRYDGFSPEDVATFLEVTGAVCQDVAGYAFTNVGQLCRDFHDGRFAPAFHVERETPPEHEARVAALRRRLAYYEQQPSLNRVQLARLSQYQQRLADRQHDVSAAATQAVHVSPAACPGPSLDSDSPSESA